MNSSSRRQPNEIDPDEYIRELVADIHRAGIDDEETQMDIFRFETSRERDERIQSMFKLGAMGNRIVPLAKARAMRSPDLRDWWLRVLADIHTPEGRSAIVELHGTSSGEALQEKSTADLIEILRNENIFEQQDRIRAIGHVLATRDEHSHEALVNAIHAELVHGTVYAPNALLSLKLAASSAGSGCVLGLIRLLLDRELTRGRDDIAQLLGQIGDSRAVPALKQVLETESENPGLMSQVMWSLNVLDRSSRRSQ